MIRRALAVALVAGVFMIPQSISGQYIGLTQWTTGPGSNGHYYAMTQLAGDYRDVSGVAAGLRGTLASITTAEENEFVYNSFVAFGTCSPVWCLPSTFYIGLERVSSGGPFAWATGEHLSFTAWNEGEPNDLGDERVAHMFRGTPGQPAAAAPEGEGVVMWNDISYDKYPMRGVIEWSVAPCGHDHDSEGEYEGEYEGEHEGRRGCVSVPEPSTYMLMLTGLFGLGFVAWRRKEEDEAA